MQSVAYFHLSFLPHSSQLLNYLFCLPHNISISSEPTNLNGDLRWPLLSALCRLIIMEAFRANGQHTPFEMVRVYSCGFSSSLQFHRVGFSFHFTINQQNFVTFGHWIHSTTQIYTNAHAQISERQKNFS